MLLKNPNYEKKCIELINQTKSEIFSKKNSWFILKWGFLATNVSKRKSKLFGKNTGFTKNFYFTTYWKLDFCGKINYFYLKTELLSKDKLRIDVLLKLFMKPYSFFLENESVYCRSKLCEKKIQFIYKKQNVYAKNYIFTENFRRKI